jgi:hypothetical protein
MILRLNGIYQYKNIVINSIKVQTNFDHLLKNIYVILPLLHDTEI